MEKGYRDVTDVKSKDLLGPLKRLFWSYDISELDIAKNEKTIILNVINYGDMTDWSRLVSIYGKERVRPVLETEATELRPRVRRLVALVFNIDNFNYAERGTDR